ncbi:MAG: hypothetical protein WAO76_16115 [Georgfuchsia sp.]
MNMDKSRTVGRGGRAEVIWMEFCDELKSAGLGALATRTEPDGPIAADTLRHLVRLLGAATELLVQNADPLFPRFSRMSGNGAYLTHEDVSWLLAPVRHGEEYVVRGNVSGLHDINVSVICSYPHAARSVGNLGFEELVVAADGNVEIVLGGEGRNAITLPEDARYVAIREYYYDWEHETPHPFSIERRGRELAAPQRIDLETVAAQIGAVPGWIVDYISEFDALKASMSAAPLNTIVAPRGSDTGSIHIGYGWGPFAVGEEEALLIEFEVPQARHWTLQWMVQDLLANPDMVHRVTSVRGQDAHVDSDGKVRAIASARDPGVRNWLDITGYGAGMLVYRWIRCSNQPEPVARVVPFDNLHTQIPSDTPLFTTAERAVQLAVRREHFARLGR